MIRRYENDLHRADGTPKARSGKAAALKGSLCWATVPGIMGKQELHPLLGRKKPRRLVNC